MHTRTLTAKDGWGWLPAGFAIFRKNPPFLTAVSVSFFVTLSLLSSVLRVAPLLGLAAALLIIPAASVSVMTAARSVDGGEKPSPLVLLAGFRSNYKQLLLLGFIQFLVVLGIVMLAWAIDEALFLQIALGLTTLGEDATLPPEALLSGLVSGALVTLVTMIWWYAPALSAWHQMPALKAMFFSLVACIRNWRPFLTYSMAVTLLTVVAPQLIGSLLFGLFPDVKQVIATIVMVVAVFIILPTLFASFYVTYRDVFVSPHDSIDIIADDDV